MTLFDFHDQDRRIFRTMEHLKVSRFTQRRFHRVIDYVSTDIIRKLLIIVHLKYGNWHGCIMISRYFIF